MNVARVAALTALVGILAFATASAPVSAADDPNVGCGGDVVEACFPVCVTDPCPSYVCVHRYVEICREL